MSKYTPKQIDEMTWAEARAAAKAEHGVKGSWVSDCIMPRLKAMLKGEITPAEAQAQTVADKAKKAGIALGGGTVDLKPIEDKITTLEVETRKMVGELESETKRMLAAESEAVETIKKMIEDAIAKGGASAAKVIAPIIGVATSSSADPVVMALETYCSPGRAVKPVLVRGEAGAGKTYGARQHGRTAGFDRCIEFGVHEQTEAVDFLGNLLPDGSWMDGPLTEGFRAAAVGQLVLVIIDEYYRAQGGARTPLLTATSPDRLPSGEKVYRLRTGRSIVDPVTGVKTSEVLEAPCRNLAIVATTNVGAQYNVDQGCPAERERFIPIHVDVDEAKMRAVCESIATAKSFNPAVVDKLIAFYRECKALKQDSFIELCPSTRILSEAVEYADTEADIKAKVSSLGLHIWVGMTIDGKPEVEQLRKVNNALDKAFGK